MSLFGGAISVTGVSFLMFSVFAIIGVGYAFGRITIKGVSLGDAGVFIMALVFGCLFYGSLADTMVIKQTVDGVVTKTGYAKEALKIVENLGLMLFVTSVGFIAGPTFFSNMKKNFKSYVLLGLIIIVTGGIAAVLCLLFGRAFGGETDADRFTAIVSGLFSGALTSTPAFSAAKECVGAEYEGLVAVGNGIAYIFGVLGVVLFVQLIPKFMKANMDEERAKLAAAAGKTEKKEYKGKLLFLDDHGLAPFAFAALLGVVIGKIEIPLTATSSFSLSTTGGCLLVALVLGHFGRIGCVSVMPQNGTLKIFRELGLVLFLTGAGVAGGAEFIANFKPVYFLYGMVMTILPMIIGFIFAVKVLKLPLLNALGSITGGMTSTPALGTLIGVSGTEAVASAYAATYPIALIAVVLVAQFLNILF